MNRNLRKTVIAGNWKMNMTPSQTTAFMKELTPMVTDAACDVVLCVPAIDIPAAVAATAGTLVGAGAGVGSAVSAVAGGAAVAGASSTCGRTMQAVTLNPTTAAQTANAPAPKRR